MKSKTLSLCLAMAMLGACATGGGKITSQEGGGRDDRARSGGGATVFSTSRNAFNHSAPNMPPEMLSDFAFGDRLFNTHWVTAPASVEIFDGLGPLFNRVSCGACHTRDGRGRAPEGPAEPMMSMLVRLSVPGQDSNGGPRGHPVYGSQLNDRAILGVPAEGRAAVNWQEVSRRYPDGTPYMLRRPVIEIVDLAYGPLGDDILTSPRVAPVSFGLGLLEAVDEKTILSFADPDDRDGDGISGRLNRVWDAVHQKMSLGRFGWKANQPSIHQQNAGAALGDIGITTPLFPDENFSPAQKQAAEAPHGGRPEMSAEFLRTLILYTRSLAVPARRDLDDPQVRLGEALFEKSQCTKCHIPSMATGVHSDPGFSFLNHQIIRPYTDLLLHDMGEDLADGRPDFQATGSEWRTPPLWGIGLIPSVNRHQQLLHDGRARGVEEAILWHGGEAEKSRELFKALSAEQRAALVRFVNSL